MPRNLRLRGNAPRRSGPYPLGEIPDSVANEIGKRIVHRLAVGNSDITGDDFGTIFAAAISGVHRGSPLGIADVCWNGCAWTVKTVKDTRPFAATRARLISGRNSPVYSAGITDNMADIQATGRAVLEVWNARVNESLTQHDDLRVFTMLRNLGTLEFMLFETEAVRYIPTNYTWSVNGRGNFEAHHVQSGAHCFTWQPHGSQFTMIVQVPTTTYKFRITRRPGMIEEHHVLQLIGFDTDWIQRVPDEG